MIFSSIVLMLFPLMLFWFSARGSPRKPGDSYSIMGDFDEDNRDGGIGRNWQERASSWRAGSVMGCFGLGSVFSRRSQSVWFTWVALYYGSSHTNNTEIHIGIAMARDYLREIILLTPGTVRKSTAATLLNQWQPFFVCSSLITHKLLLLLAKVIKHSKRLPLLKKRRVIRPHPDLKIDKANSQNLS